MTKKNMFNFRGHWQEIASERFYTLARWVVLVLLFAISFPTMQSSIWPISLESDAVVLTLWAYAVFSLLASIALFIPPLGTLVRYAYIADMLFIILLSLFSRANTVLFLPFYSLPLISAAVRQKPLISFASGIVAAILYSIVSMTHGDAGTRIDISLVMQALMIVFIPWFTGSLVKHSTSRINRQLSEAEQRKEQAQNEVQRYRERLHSFSNVTTTLATSLDYKQVLNTALREVQKLAPYHVGLVILSSGRPKELFAAVVEPSNPPDQDRTFNINGGIASKIMQPSSTAMLVDDISKEHELEPLNSLRSCKAACIIPLRLKLVTYGMLVVASNETDAFTHEHLDLLTGMANYIIVALHTTQLAFDVRQGNSKLLAKEKEVRDRIASRLHDGPTQKVAQITMQTDFVKKVAEKDPAMLQAELDKFAELAKTANSEMRMTLFELRPLTLETEGLPAALREYAEKMKLRAGSTQIKIETRGSVDTALDLEAAGVLFDIIQESVNNALKHAEASTIVIRAERREERVIVTIKDDGKGFDPVAAKEAAAKRASFGLHNFSERAQMIGGVVDIDSAPGKGATITLTAPVKE